MAGRRATISRALVLNAIDYVKQAQAACANARPDEEIRFSLGAHLMLALAMEGVANEIGEATFDKWSWDRLEKSDTPLKWRLVSSFDGRSPFAPDKEPLQTIQHLSRIRNRIAHPKPEPLGDETIVTTKTGELKRHVKDEYKLQDGDNIYVGYGKRLDAFNAQTSSESTTKAIRAIKLMRDHMNADGLEWLEGAERLLSMSHFDAH